MKFQRLHIYIPLLCNHNTRTAHTSLKLVCGTATWATNTLKSWPCDPLQKGVRLRGGDSSTVSLSTCVQNKCKNWLQSYLSSFVRLRMIGPGGAAMSFVSAKSAADSTALTSVHASRICKWGLILRRMRPSLIGFTKAS